MTVGPGCPPWEDSSDCKHLSCHQLSPGQRVSGPPLPRGFPRRNHVHTDHPTHVQVRGNRRHCPLAGVTGASGSPRAPSPASHQRPTAPPRRRRRDWGQTGGVHRVLPPSDFSGKPAPLAGRARLSPLLALGGARLSPAARLGARLRSAAAAARAFLRSSARGRARPARAHAGHQMRGGRRRVSARRGAAGRGGGGREDPGWAGRAVPGRGQPDGRRAWRRRARWGGVRAGRPAAGPGLQPRRT